MTARARATASSMASSSTPNTTSPATAERMPRMMVSSASRKPAAASRSSALTVTRTLIPSMPLAKKAMVAWLPGPSSSLM